MTSISINLVKFQFSTHKPHTCCVPENLATCGKRPSSTLFPFHLRGVRRGSRGHLSHPPTSTTLDLLSGWPRRTISGVINLNKAYFLHIWLALASRGLAQAEGLLAIRSRFHENENINITPTPPAAGSVLRFLDKTLVLGEISAIFEDQGAASECWWN